MRRKTNNDTAVARTCGECSRGRWSDKHTNRDANGVPFMKECEFSDWAINKDGKRVCLRSTRACDKFERL